MHSARAGTVASRVIGRRASRSASFLREHSLSLALAAIVGFLVVMYGQSDQQTHVGAFYGNAIADWLGVLVFVIATKYFFEAGSGESRKPPRRFHQRVGRLLVKHSLTIVLALSGAAWVVAYARSDVNGKTGQVLGSLVSNWLQVLGLVLITKYARERGSKEGH
jgi:hypothetical protein